MPEKKKIKVKVKKRRLKVKKILVSAALIVTLCMFTACGNTNNAADEADTNGKI